MSTAKEKYIAFIKENYVPIFYRQEYLDIVCDGHWDVVLFEEGEKITAAYIYMIKHKFCIKYIIQPQLCPYTGPLFFNPKDPNKAYGYLIKNLPGHQLIIQDFFHGIPNLKGFNYTQLKKHTYIVNANSDIEELWNNQSSNHRRIIRKADRELTYVQGQSIDEFLDFVTKTFQKRNKRIPTNRSIHKELDAMLNGGGHRKIVKCTNSDGEVVAMGYFINDEKWTYNIANGVVETYKHYGMNLILWNEIKASLSEGRSFDFEGSMLPGVDEFFSRYKGEKTMYQTRIKSSNMFIDLLVRLKRMTVNK